MVINNIYFNENWVKSIPTENELVNKLPHLKKEIVITAFKLIHDDNKSNEHSHTEIEPTNGSEAEHTKKRRNNK
jgi:hypothetical protein